MKDIIQGNNISARRRRLKATMSGQLLENSVSHDDVEYIFNDPKIVNSAAEQDDERITTRANKLEPLVTRRELWSYYCEFSLCLLNRLIH